MEGLHVGIISMAILIILLPAALVWYIVFGGIFLTVKRYLQKNVQLMLCSVDMDCPEGYICVGGKCVLKQ